MKITNIEQDNSIYSIHNIKILIVYLLEKIMEKVHLHTNKIKLEGIIKKRIFKNKKNKKTNVLIKKNNKKNNTENNNIINVDIINNKNVVLKINNKNNNDNKKNNKNKNNDDDNNKNNNKKCIFKLSITDAIKGIFELVKEIINGNLTSKSFENVANNYIKYYKIDTSIYNKRICKTPFKKWNVKGYTNKSDLVKIMNYLLGFSSETLNKNLMVKIKNSKITEINFVVNNNK